MRTTGPDEEHKRVAGRCFVYKTRLTSNSALNEIEYFLEKLSAVPPRVEWRLSTVPPKYTFTTEITLLEDLFVSNREIQIHSVPIGFQTLGLAYSGKIRPRGVRDLTAIIAQLSQVYNRRQIAKGLRRLRQVLPYPDPHIPAAEFEVLKLEEGLFKYASGIAHGSLSRVQKKNPQLRQIYHVDIIPAGVYLGGPELEVANRVIRKHEAHLDSFIRATFCDEDGQ
jgi:RNA dependent RNA polymerase